MADRILIVEDDESLLRLLVRCLRELDYDVLGVGTAAEAQAAAQREQWSLAIIDRRLPDADGDTLRPSLGNMPVLTISGQDIADLQKPFRLHELQLAVAAKLRGGT